MLKARLLLILLIVSGCELGSQSQYYPIESYNLRSYQHGDKLTYYLFGSDLAGNEFNGDVIRQYELTNIVAPVGIDSGITNGLLDQTLIRISNRSDILQKYYMQQAESGALNWYAIENLDGKIYWIREDAQATNFGALAFPSPLPRSDYQNTLSLYDCDSGSCQLAGEMDLSLLYQGVVKRETNYAEFESLHYRFKLVVSSSASSAMLDPDRFVSEDSDIWIHPAYGIVASVNRFFDPNRQTNNFTTINTSLTLVSLQ